MESLLTSAPTFPGRGSGFWGKPRDLGSYTAIGRELRRGNLRSPAAGCRAA
jgi:hypothetical protein